MTSAEPKCERCGYDLTGLVGSRCPECGRQLDSSCPLGRYRERSMDVRREFTLRADCIDVRTRWLLRGDAEVRVPLGRLEPQPSRCRLRHRFFKAGVVLFAIGLGFVLLIQFAHLMDALSPLYLCLVAAATVVGAGLAGACARPIEYLRFHDKTRPEVVLLDIARAGPDTDQFDDFALAIQRQIRAAQQPAAR